MKDLEMLGFRVRDRVTGFEGVVESISYDLYGCIQAVVRPAVNPDKKHEVPDGRWFDLKRLEKTSPATVMTAPVFPADVKLAKRVNGGSEKPLLR
jgi:hypothetical protein